MHKFISIHIGLLSTVSVLSVEEQPNIVYILADDLGYGDLGCYGQKLISTPHIDALASNGMLFTQHYSGSPVSAPSRTSLLTGQHTGHTFIRGNKDFKDLGDGQYPLPATTFTIAQMLKNEGYVTGAFGKWGLGGVGTDGDPMKMGFDHFFGYNCQQLAHNHYPHFLYRNNEKILLEGNVGSAIGVYAPDSIQQEALRFIAANAKQKFFLFLPYTLPHAELSSPKDSIFNLYKEALTHGTPYVGVDNGPRYKRGGYGSSAQPHADYAAMVTRLDAYVGQIVQQLKKMGVEKNTLILFTSDNGPHREGGADPFYFESKGKFRGLKRDVYEGGIRVPMIASWPDKIVAGSENHHVSAFWDVMPTCKQLVKSTKKIKTDGISFLPSLLGEKKQKKHKYLYWEFHEEGGKVAVRYENWKGIKLNYSTNPNGKMQLYDLSTDLHEDIDLSSEYPKIVAKLEKIIKKEHVKSSLFYFDWEK